MHLHQGHIYSSGIKQTQTKDQVQVACFTWSYFCSTGPYFPIPDWPYIHVKCESHPHIFKHQTELLTIFNYKQKIESNMRSYIWKQRKEDGSHCRVGKLSKTCPLTPGLVPRHSDSERQAQLPTCPQRPHLRVPVSMAKVYLKCLQNI